LRMLSVDGREVFTPRVVMTMQHAGMPICVRHAGCVTQAATST
jgi:hypothetical protein